MMDWVYNHLLLPVLNVLYVPCDWLLGWTERFAPVVSISGCRRAASQCSSI